MIVLEAVFLVIFWTWFALAVLLLRSTFLPPTPITDTPERLGVPAQLVRFPATDGTPLEGWVLSGDPTHPWVILCHRLYSNRSDMLKLAAGLRSSGFNLLLFDFRGHGGSAGRTTSFGWTEQHDLQGALAFLGQQPDIPPRPYGVYGASMGAAVALLVAAKDERIGAVAAEGAYTDLHDTLARHLHLLYHLPPTPFAWFLAITYRLRYGIWPKHVSPLVAAPALTPKPILFIQGTMDTRTTADGTRRLFDAAHDPRDLWIIRGAGHLDAFTADPDSYARRLSDFFRRGLAL